MASFYALPQVLKKPITEHLSICHFLRNLFPLNPPINACQMSGSLGASTGASTELFVRNGPHSERRVPHRPLSKNCTNARCASNQQLYEFTGSSTNLKTSSSSAQKPSAESTPKSPPESTAAPPPTFRSTARFWRFLYAACARFRFDM